MTLKETNEKFIRGKDGLTDGDLCGLLNFYKNLNDVADELDSDFSLFQKEIRRRYEVLRSFEEARKV